MTAISILPLEPRAYAVRIREGDVETDHKVTVPQGVLDDVGPEVDEDALVRASIEFLLEREPATSILADFSLDVIPRYFDGYVEELRDRLGRPELPPA